jgi:hypothetical protein
VLQSAQKATPTRDTLASSDLAWNTVTARHRGKNTPKTKVPEVAPNKGATAGATARPTPPPPLLLTKPEEEEDSTYSATNLMVIDLRKLVRVLTMTFCSTPAKAIVTALKETYPETDPQTQLMDLKEDVRQHIIEILPAMVDREVMEVTPPSTPVEVTPPTPSTPPKAGTQIDKTIVRQKQALNKNNQPKNVQERKSPAASPVPTPEMCETLEMEHSGQDRKKRSLSASEEVSPQKKDSKTSDLNGQNRHQ